MKLLDALLSRSRPVKSRLEPLFSMATASVTLTVQLGLEPEGRAGICLRPVDSSVFGRAREELRAMITGEGGTRLQFEHDKHGFLWVILENAQVEDLVAAMHMSSLTLQDLGFAEQLLAAVFRFRKDTAPVFWIYNYKRGRFYPMVPAPGDQQRDNAAELRLHSLLEHELPMEQAQERWYPLWDMPV